MATLTKTQFKEQLKDPEIATIRRKIHLVRKAVKEHNWMVTSHHDKRCKCFDLKMTPRVFNVKNYGRHWVEQHFNDVYKVTADILKGRSYTTITNDMCDTITISIPYNRPKD